MVQPALTAPRRQDPTLFSRFRALLDVRPGEGLPLLLTFLYIASVIASFTLAKPIRSGLFLRRFPPEGLVYVYVGVPLILTLLVPLYTAIAVRVGQHKMITGTLLFFSLNVLMFWYFFEFHRFDALASAFYIWVNCFGVIAPVQVWTFANSTFDTRQAKRLFGLIGTGASLGAISGGLMASLLPSVVGGTVNLLLVLALLIAAAAVMVNMAFRFRPRRSGSTKERITSVAFWRTLGQIAQTPYLRSIATIVFLVAIATQWTGFQLSLIAKQRFGNDADLMTQFFGRFSFAFGMVAFFIQLIATGPLLRRFGIGVGVVLLPIALGLGSLMTLIAPALWSVLLTNAFDQTLRFSVDKASFELLYVPLRSSVKWKVKSTIDVIVNRVADGVGGIVLGLLTSGFSLVVFRLPGLQLGLRGLAAATFVLTVIWATVAFRLRTGYVESIRDSIHRHRVDAERISVPTLDRSAYELLTERLHDSEPEEILYALSLLDSERGGATHPAVRGLFTHADPDVRQRAVQLLRERHDGTAVSEVDRLLTDPDLGVRTEALLYLAEHAGIDPLTRLQELGEFADFSIRSAMVSYLARPGRTQNLDAARALLDAMVREEGAEGQPMRLEAARLIQSLPDEFDEQLATLLRDPDSDVAKQAILATGKLQKAWHIDAVVGRLEEPTLRDEAADALAQIGNAAVATLRRYLLDSGAPASIRRQIPGVLMRIGTPASEQSLMEGLLESDTTLRFRIIASLNKLRKQHPEMVIDTQAIEALLGAEIVGHYRSYQVLGALGDALVDDNPVVGTLKRSMEQEVERIFRLMGLLFPGDDFHSAYFGLRSTNKRVRANALEFLDNVLRPQLRNVLVPLLDSQVALAERVQMANRLLGTSVESREEAVATLLASDDPWLRSCAAYAIGVMRLESLEGALDKWLDDPDPLLRATARSAKERFSMPEEELAGEAEVPPVDLEDSHWHAGTMGLG